MLVYSKVNSVNMNIVGGAAQLTVTVTVGFDNSGTAVNTTTNAYISGTNLLTALLVDDQVRAAVKDFVNSTYSKSISSSDVILSGGFNIPLL